ncbi:MAG TPA: sigma-70 family RNA polymerase sigma factor [Rhodanobacteraceae bacterium]|nr:sigma-70 family RNA polymerase sigma factor [Rhodanobacteraceae bacterium]
MMARMTAYSSDGAAALSHLLQAVAAGDRSAFTTLYQRTSSKLFGLCTQMLRDRGDAEDALQEVYASVWLRAPTFDSTRAAAMTWLITLARNQCIDRLRRHRPDRLDDATAANLVDPDPAPQAQAEASEARRRLEQCLATLADRQRDAVRAAFYSGATYNQLAGRLGVPLATMKSWVRRGLTRLRACLEQSEANP